MTTRLRKLLGVLLLVTGVAVAHFTDGRFVGWMGVLGVFTGTLIAIWPKDDPIRWTALKAGCVIGALAVTFVTLSDSVFIQLWGWGWGAGSLFLIWFKPPSS